MGNHCSHCAAELKPGQKVCDYCGQELEVYEADFSNGVNFSNGVDFSNGADFSDGADKIGALLAYVGKNREYYAKTFRKMKDTGKKNTWNWSAFFFGPFWLAYRKVYLPAFVIAVVSVFTEQLLLHTALVILVAIFGNYIYMAHIERLVEKEKSFVGGLEREKFINKNGGTSIIGIFVLLLIMFLI